MSKDLTVFERVDSIVEGLIEVVEGDKITSLYDLERKDSIGDDKFSLVVIKIYAQYMSVILELNFKNGLLRHHEFYTRFDSEIKVNSIVHDLKKDVDEYLVEVYK